MLDNLSCEEIFAKTQSKPPLAQLQADPLSLVTWEKRLKTFFNVVLESEVSPDPSLLMNKQPSFPQPLLTRCMI